MDRDYIWEGEYGRRSHLIPVFQQLLREQDASSLQMLSLFVNNNPYNLEFFIAVSYDRPKEEHLDRMFRLLEDAGLRQRKDLTARNIMRAMAGASTLPLCWMRTVFPPSWSTSFSSRRSGSWRRKATV